MGSGHPSQGNLAPTIVIGEIDDATLVIESEGIASNDNDLTFPTSAAVKDYSDTTSLSSTLTDAQIFVGNGSNVATDVAVSGDITMANTGAVAIAAGVIVDADLASGVFANITGVGAQSQTLDMSTQSIDNVNDFTMDSTSSHIISMERNEAVTDDVVIGQIDFKAHEDVGGTPVLGTYGQIICTVEDETQATEDGSMKFLNYTAGTAATLWMSYNDAANATIDLLKNTAVTGTASVSGLLTATVGIDVVGTDIDNINNAIYDIETTGTDIDFAEDDVVTISIAGNTTFTTANIAAGKTKIVRITTDGTLRTLTFPSWDFIGTKPADQAASKVGLLSLVCFGSDDANIVASYAVEA